MTGFNEQWLAAHNARMAGITAENLPLLPDRICFFIPLLLKLPNAMPANPWAATAERKKLHRLLIPILVPFAGRKPMQQAIVTITRRSCGDRRPDPDNNIASFKRLIDLLLVQSKAHPDSFGIIVDDNAANLRINQSSERAAGRMDQGTFVVIARSFW